MGPYRPVDDPTQEMATGENAIIACIVFRCGHANAPHFVNRQSGRPHLPWRQDRRGIPIGRRVH